MIYLASLKEKGRFFEKPYKFKDGKHIGNVILRDTKRCKTSFMKRRDLEVIFPEALRKDNIIGKRIKGITGDTKRILLPHVSEMIKETIEFFSLKVPLNEITVFSKECEREAILPAVPFARLITVIGNDSGGICEKGIPLRFEKRFRRIPSLAILLDDDARLSPILKIPTVDLRKEPGSEGNVLSKRSAAFFVPECLEELKCGTLNADTIAYFNERGFDFTPKLCSLRKKSPSFFTFS